MTRSGRSFGTAAMSEEFARWLLSQGVAVATLAFVLWRLDARLESLIEAVSDLTRQVALAEQLGRRPLPPTSG